MLLICSISFWAFIERKTATVDLAQVIGYSDIDFANEKVLFE